MAVTIPRSLGPFGKSQGGIAIRIAGPVLGSLAGAAASWAVYSYVRRGPSLLSGFASRFKALIPGMRPSALGAGEHGQSTPSPERNQSVSLPEAKPEPELAPRAGARQDQSDRDWTQPLLEAMRKEPREYGFNKLEWSAPLLGQYLEKHHGQSIPVSRIRNALKESGYEWHVTRYKKANRHG